MMERPTTIRADQWELVAEDVRAGRCEVVDMFAEPVQEILLLPDGGFHVTSPNPETSEWQGKLGAVDVDVFTVRWLDTAPATSAPEAVSNAELYELRDIVNNIVIAANPVGNWGGDLRKLLPEYVASLQAERDDLQAQRDDLAKSLQTIGAALGLSGQFKKQYGTAHIEQVVKTIMEDREIITDIRNLCMKAQAERDELARKVAAAGDRVTALETVYEAVVQCDLQSDMLDAYKAPYDDSVHTDNINFDALNEWADLSNALDYLRDNEATPQPAPAGEDKAGLHLFTIKGLAAGVATLSPKSPTYIESVNNAMNLIIRKVDTIISDQAAPQPAGNSELVEAEMREQLGHLQSVVLDSATKTGDKDHILELIDNLFGLIDKK